MVAGGGGWKKVEEVIGKEITIGENGEVWI